MKVEQNSHEPSNYRASTNPTLGISSVAGTRQPAGLPRGRLVCRRRPTSAVGPIEASFLFHLYGTDAVLIRLRCRGDLNLHTLTGWVHAPQACASANSATTAKSTASLQTNSNPLPQAITAAHVGLSSQLASEFMPPNRGRPLRPGPFVSARVRPTCNERIRHAGKRCGAQGDFFREAAARYDLAQARKPSGMPSGRSTLRRFGATTRTCGRCSLLKLHRSIP